MIKKNIWNLSLPAHNIFLIYVYFIFTKIGNKVDTVNEENERKSKDFQEVQRKLTDYYKFVAELKSDNLRLSTEKSAAEQLLEEVRGKSVSRKK